MEAIKPLLKHISFAALLLTVAACDNRPSESPLTLNESLAAIERSARAGEFGNIHSLVAVQAGAQKAAWYFTGTDERYGVALGSITFDGHVSFPVKWTIPK